MGWMKAEQEAIVTEKKEIGGKNRVIGRYLLSHKHNAHSLTQVRQLSLNPNCDHLYKT